jgi:hypothetical protein
MHSSKLRTRRICIVLYLLVREFVKLHNLFPENMHSFTSHGQRMCTVSSPIVRENVQFQTPYSQKMHSGINRTQRICMVFTPYTWLICTVSFSVRWVLFIPLAWRVHGTLSLQRFTSFCILGENVHCRRTTWTDDLYLKRADWRTRFLVAFFGLEE